MPQLFSPPGKHRQRPRADGPLVSGGWCRRCERDHFLPSGAAQQACHDLMVQLERHRRIDLEVAEDLADPRCATAGLFAEAGGKMFGVLTCRDAGGTPVVLRAFSGQYNGLWQVPGWVGPVFDPLAFQRLSAPVESRIKALGRRLTRLPEHAPARLLLREQRRILSRQLMGAIHGLYQLVNFRGDQAPLTTVFLGRGLPPTGTGDCCAPKLLHHAAQLGLRPEGLAEMYWGRANRSATRQHGHLYPACAEKCRPILGFMLCGLS
ncbi:hypothetical protein [Desulfobulbus alkaliphilus]|uniref:hypothetical protein n=1 Tax=Desulfobulbus alkaliphilus TaxID=869814 RepID=UPI0019622CD1|nr:hypothetical protein [Desulfobulbus alkaliphilus]MBM9536807.1 hypothetical protein [Desulfobulbus alkaliphilus]